MTAEAFRAELEWRMDLCRPDRYREDDRRWMLPVITWARDQLSRDPTLLAELERQDRWPVGS
jgi:hypothetical protein